MASAVARGRYYQQRSRDWLEGHGYVVALMERMFGTWTPGGTRYTKQDQMGADLLAASIWRTVYVQVRGGASWRDHLADARQEFLRYPLGPGAEQWILGWTPRAHAPELIVVRVGPCAPEVWTEPKPPRRRPKELPLFAQTASRSRSGRARMAADARLATRQGYTP